MRVAIYARYSSDLQRQASIADQFRNCEQIIEREGWQIAARFKDEALSGAKADRPGYVALMAAAKLGEFDIIVVEEVSRLWRDQEEQWRAVRRLEFGGVHILGVNDGVNTRSEGYGLLLSIRGAINEEARREISKRTHRGLSGVALSGNSAGGRSYGYRHVPVEDPSRRDHLGRPVVVSVRREVDEEQARWVRLIFEKYADGWSPRRIANELNCLGVPAPGATWNRKRRVCKGWAASAIYGDHKRGFGILLNPLYGGVYIWNRTRRQVDPETKARKHAARAKSEWIVTEAPELRIVHRELLERVEARLATQRRTHGKHNGPGPKYLLSGLLKCGVCGGNYVVMNATSYGCAVHKDRGPHVCANALKVPRRLVESKLLEGVKHDLLSAENLALFRKEVVRLLRERKRTNNTDATRRLLTDTESAIGNLIEAIKVGVYTRSTKAELERLEGERDRLRATVKDDSGDRGNIVTFLPGIVGRFQDLVNDLENAMLHDLPIAREQLRHLIGDTVKLVPNGDHLVAELCLNYKGLIQLTGTVNYAGTEERT